MDMISHGFIAYALLHRLPYSWLVLPIAFMPDIITFLPLLLQGKALTENSKREDVPNYVVTLYAITHSLVTYAVVFLIVAYFFGAWALLLGAWLIHILIDIPLHEADLLPVRFLYPLSNVHINGISYATPQFRLFNYAIITLLYIWGF